MFSVLSVFEIDIVKLSPIHLMRYKTSKLIDYSLLFSNLLIIDRPHWKYWINYYHLSSIINKRQLERIGSLFIDNNPQRFEGIEVIPASIKVTASMKQKQNRAHSMTEGVDLMMRWFSVNNMSGVTLTQQWQQDRLLENFHRGSKWAIVESNSGGNY